MAKLITIDDGNFHNHLHAPAGLKKGLVPRDFRTHPLGCYSAIPAFDMPLFSDSEVDDRVAEQVKAQSSLYDLRKTQGPGGGLIPSRDQNGRGYCWAHSSVSAMMLARAAMAEPYADLSAYAVACIIKNYADEGGWGAESAQFIADRGVPTSQFWPQKSVNRSNDNANTWADAAKYKFFKFYQLGHQDMWRECCTCLALNIPIVADFNWWSHSVCLCRLKSRANKLGTILNSWGDSWSDQGMGDLSGGKVVPDDAVAVVWAKPSA